MLQSSGFFFTFNPNLDCFPMSAGLKRCILLILFSGFVTLGSCTNHSDWIFTPEDQQLVEKKLRQFAPGKNRPIADLLVEIGFTFQETPYVAATLENGPEEKLVINLRELDCTTFVETCLALARTVKAGKTDFDSYGAELEKIRYRNGIRNQYLSRLHYFWEWILDNSKKQLVSDQPNHNGEKAVKAIQFMSTHPDSYPVLKEHRELIPVLTEQEKALSANAFWYFPKTNPENLEKNLKNGDIIGLTAPVESSIDINHTGIIVEKSGQFYLLHGSQSHKKVLLSAEPISDFLRPESKNSGVMIARPVDE